MMSRGLRTRVSGDRRMGNLPPYARDPRVDYVLLSEEQIRRRVARLAREIAAAYRPDQGLYVLGVLTGAFVFTSDVFGVADDTVVASDATGTSVFRGAHLIVIDLDWWQKK